MTTWTLDQTVDTSAGRVAAGSAGDGPALVLAHGWPWSSFAWSRVIPLLADRFHVHWYDMPGFGRSTLTPTRPPALDTQGEVFAEMLDHWSLDAPTVVAHDFGGAVTLRAHLLHGTDYSRLILMNVVAMRPWGSDFFEHVKTHVDAFRGLPPHIHKAIVCAYIDSALARPLAPGDYDRLDTPWLSAEGQQAFWTQFALADERYTAEVEPAYGDLRCPAAVLWGTADPWIPLTRGEALARAIGVPLQPLEGLGHLPQLEDPDRVVAHLTKELESA
ncbi:alpha/beta fold hydrolase [Pelagovum pacificum]|uniref:Alpha/beta hydrolase n=1 Tax=Pelagovum pacificum TaxID=2588711 RepID=A0A5C5GDM1_9RHOB|nr:alpha/beta hydrolase [Pelagovum pacificum]QQA44084.1 alpha/beta hydrolase [Pelagovum pacificum]TNY32788.1 alpha/beta hydrolase [Pelagovum pacificum]